ncbi:polyketide synthase-like protein [Aspergillus steynii IBT 23096]|uniref:Polyketide synthase-like protein n=1 Tax=Aspergillus steynii IBT 23096 TaxID=1392250 RepID=A0A2I2G870_9EURO|nr:polyketide synthase-like protein [Aspergillus steynii IBT 23096]PLB49064.1 polyketide synthase-like protein [Aspergillus steynii IBT 23096]
MTNDTPIAIVGLSYRAPGVGRKGLWDYLAEAKSAWTEMPAERFDHKAYHNPGAERSGSFRSQGAHFLPDDIYGFDASFFNMRAEEARNSDPQHRMMLECALEAAENAGHSLIDLAGKKIGVFVGCGSQEYAHRTSEDLYSTSTFSATGVASCMFANRLSYFFDVNGPSVAIDTACASSAYAAHQACQALRNGDCNAAFVGSAALCLSPSLWITLEKMGALSPDGRSYSYDHKAAGFGRGEGAACLLVKRLDDAISNGDPIHAVIRSSACNHSGRSEGITMPSRSAQERLLREVHAAVGLDPSETPVVEGHGTGTQAGDPIEAGSFASVLAKDRTASNPLYIGSIKSNFGHLEGASGILAVVKAILMIKKGIILPTAGFEQMNVKIEGRDRLKVAESPVPWPENEARRVIVTNFGFGGSNSAVILEAAPSTASLTNGANGANGINGTNGVTNGANGHGSLADAANGTNDVTASDPLAQRLFVLSAKTEKSLTSYLGSFQEYLDAAPQSVDFLKDLSYTLGQRRTQHAYRVAATANSVDSLKEKLSTAKPSKIRDRVIAFAFTGQGAQHAQMASGLRHYKAFAHAIDRAESELQAMGATWSLTSELAKPAAQSRVNEAEISQPACTAVQLALVILLQSWGITATTVTGHSSGEIGAAFAAGLVSFRAAIAIAFFRGQAAAQLAREQTKKGGMLALGTGFEDASKLIEQHADGYATVAAINSPQSVTVSGDQSSIEKIHKVADAQGLFARRLKIEVAYHSKHMEQVAASYLATIKPYCNADDSLLSKSNERAVFVSSVTGGVVDPASVDASYWVKNLVQPVRFADAIETIFSPKEDSDKKLPNVMVEIGPHAALKSPIKQTVDLIRQRHGQRQTPFAYLASLVRGTPGDEALLGLAGSLFTMGPTIQLGLINQTGIHNAHVLTDIPAYAWDKSVKYEHKPRATQEKMFPGEPYHPLLGRKTASNGGSERSYRQVFNLDELPWVRDHNVAGVVVYPMTGYLSCAIEAVRRTVPTEAAAIVVRDFHAIRSLEIDEEETVDMMTTLRPAPTGTGTFSSTVWTFEISTWKESEGWTRHCNGRIETESTEMTTETPTFKSSLPLVDVTGLKEHDAHIEYATAGQRGTKYGPAFMSTVKFHEGKGYTVIEAQLRDLESSLPTQYGSPVSVDPPTLDGFLQGGGPLQEVDGKRPAQMPNYISRLRVSNHIPSDPKQKFTVVTRLLNYDVKGGRMYIGVAAFAQGKDGLTPVAEWESVTFRSILSAESDDPAARLPSTWCWDLVPSFDFIPSSELYGKFSAGDLTKAENGRRRLLSHTAAYYMNKALKETAQDDLSKLPHHLSRFVGWAARAVSREVAREGLDLSGDHTALLEDVRTHDAQGELLCAIGEELVPILRGEVQPLEIMLKDGLLTRHYEADVGNAHFSKVLGEWVLHLSDLEPDLRILEIGGGTAGTTLHVLEALSRDREVPAFLDYTFTDISTGFFENARTKLANWSNRIIYKKFDVSQDPVSQGFATQDYDLVIASNVLHATPNMVDTMTNVRSLLKPKGKLLLLEAGQHPPPTLPFALLPGWWYAEDHYRDHEEGPLLSVDGWKRLLLDSGFSGVDAAVQDYPGKPEQMLSVICSHRVCKQADDSHITVCGPFLDDEEVEFAQLVADTISDSLDCTTEVKPLGEVVPADDPYCIFIDSPRQSLLANVDADTFEVLKNFLIHNTGLLWVIPEGGAPESESIKGMFRTFRLENEPKNLLWFDNVPTTSQGASAITTIAEKLRDPEVVASEDQDYVFHDGSIHLPRMRQMQGGKEQFAGEQGVPIRTVQNIWQGEGALEMTIDAAGSPDSLYFRRTEDPAKDLGADDVVVEVEAAGVSSRDLDLVLGSIPWSPLGFDGVGKVLKTGSRVSHLLEGDKVFFLALEGSAFATYKKMPAWQAARVPANISSTDAASLPLAYSIAVLALIRIARLRRNESVLIHSAAGAVGQASIVTAKHLGARIFATAGTPAKRAFLHETYGIPKDQIFSSRTSEFRDSILVATGGKGVDVIVNSLGGELLQETWALIANFGRFVEIGKKDALQNASLSMKPFDRNVTFSGVDVRELFEHRPDELRETLSEVVDLLQRNAIAPLKPVTALPISQFATALRTLRSGDNIGKVVVTFGKDERVLAESSLQPTHVELNPNATYLITGGTRGIGLSLAYWMIENGGRNVVVLGRSGGTGSEVQELLNKYKGTDVRIRALACDVGSKESLVDVLDSIKDLPPVRGVVHSALLLSDKLLENATYEDWRTITQPRVQGAWNLDALLPNLDFFIALSSFLGDTGNVGQSIYGGTSTFYDAFTKLRNSRGQNTVSIALPVVVDVGYVADRELTASLKSALGATLTMADIKTMVKGAVVGQSSPLNHNGRATAFQLSLSGESVDNLPWKYFHPVHIRERLNEDHRKRDTAEASGSGAHATSASWTSAADPLTGLIEALITKVSAMTMIERDEVEADAPLSSYGLDSLVSVELRNWIRRETSVELALTTITHAANLRALATHILAQREGAAKA